MGLPAWAWAVMALAWVAAVPIGAHFTLVLVRNAETRDEYRGYAWWLCSLSAVANVSDPAGGFRVTARLWNGELVQRRFGEHRTFTLAPNESSPAGPFAAHDSILCFSRNYSHPSLSERKPPIAAWAWAIAAVAWVYVALVVAFLCIIYLGPRICPNDRRRHASGPKLLEDGAAAAAKRTAANRAAAKRTAARATCL